MMNLLLQPRHFLLFAFLFGISNSIAQPMPSIAWETNLGGSLNETILDVKKTPNGGFIAVGYAESSDGTVTNNYGGKDVWVVKLTSDGELEWANNYGGTADEEAIAVEQLDNGNLLILSTSQSNDGDITNPLAGDTKDLWLLELDEVGNIVGSYSYGGSDGSDKATDLLLTSDGHYLLVANSTSATGDMPNNFGNQDAWMLKVNQMDGSILWSQNYGANNNDAIYNVAQALDGGFILCGEQQHPDSTLTAAGLFYFLKTDKNGVLEWEQTYGGTFPDIAQAIIPLSTGEYVAVGHSCSNDGDLGENYGRFDTWVLKLGANGALIWKNHFGGSEHDMAKAIEVMEDGGFLIATKSASSDVDVSGAKGDFDYWIFKIDAGGTHLEWQLNLGGSDFEEPYAMAKINPSEYVIAGVTKSKDGDVMAANFGQKDAWALQLNVGCKYSTQPILGNRMSDSLALVDLYQAADGDYWLDNTHWLSNKPIEEWYGVETTPICATGEKRVTQIDLSNNNLQDSLSFSLQNLYCAETLDFSQNYLRFLPLLFSSTLWDNIPLPEINVNFNQLIYDYLAANVCVFSDTSQYWQQTMDVLSDYREYGFDWPPWIPNISEEYALDSSGFLPNSYAWYFKDEMIPGVDSIRYWFWPIDSSDAGYYLRQAHYPLFENLAGCVLDSVQVYQPIQVSLIIIDDEFGDYVDNQFILQYSDTTDQNTILEYEQDLEDAGAIKIKECPCGPTIQLWAASEGVDLEHVRETAQTKTGIDTTEFNYLYPYSKNKIFGNEAVGGGFVVLETITDQSYMHMLPDAVNAPVRIGVVDSGVEDTHFGIQDYIWQNPELNDTDNCVRNDLIGYDFRNDDGDPNDLENHGTPVNGIVVRDYPLGGVELVNTKFFEGEFGDVFDAVCAMHYAMDEGVQVLNLSWGYHADTASFILEQAIQRAADNGVLIITSAGNFGLDNDLLDKWPANFTRQFDNIVVVGAYHVPTLMPDTVIYPIYSSFGDNTVHLAAPGRVLSASHNGQGNTFVGTSMATPYLTRAAAVALNDFPSMPIETIKECMLSTVDVIPEFADRVSTSGIFNFDNYKQCIIDAGLIHAVIELKAEWLPPNAVQLKWRTNYSSPEFPFTIWKSVDKMTWEKVATVDAELQSNEPLIYQWLDLSPEAGKNFYQVRRMNNIGAVGTSPTVEVTHLQSGQNLLIFPNPPTGGAITVMVEKSIEMEQLSIRNVTGELLFSTILTENTTSIVLPELVPGIYLIAARTKEGLVSGKLIIN